MKFFLEVLNEQITSCKKCSLHSKLQDGCNPVHGDGCGEAETMIIGEALGENEMLLAKPFIGIAGNMLNKMLDQAGLDRQKCYVTNTVKCRPTDCGKKNRPPTQQEIKSCSPYLWEEINIVRPKLIFTLGKVPTLELLKQVGVKKSFKLENVVGKTHTILSHGKSDSYYTTVVPNYHPSYIMQYGKAKIDRAVDIFKMWKGIFT